MKNLKLINNEWKQAVAVNITEEERVLLYGRNENDVEKRKVLVNRINAQSLVPADIADVATAQAIYDQNKIEGADLIDAEILLPEKTGIINCRIKMEHKQIRF
jgi:hypothetical protein